MLSWFALLTAGGVERREKVFSHPPFLFVLALFVGWVAISATWAEEVPGTVDTLERVVPERLPVPDRLHCGPDPGQRALARGRAGGRRVHLGDLRLMTPVEPGAADRLSGGTGNANETAAALVVGAGTGGRVGGRAPRTAAAAARRDLRGAPVRLRGAPDALARRAGGPGGGDGHRRHDVRTVADGSRSCSWGWRSRPPWSTSSTLAPPEAQERVTKFEGGTGRTDIWTVGWRMVEAEPASRHRRRELRRTPRSTTCFSRAR